ncbi:MAG: sensor histidine kinase KdpD [Chloroflexi bacterium HGW-Chloroflexi-10]|nr:MAG: sensor histidine kinase KdpD [Chloroflexi bacterium HGW-Chloroflexi-10]
MIESYSRPDPDKLLERIKAEERQQLRGKLKIFLGYVAGVGKTYAMLEAAHQRKEEGVDVVIGYIETHNRKETEALVSGLEVLPRHELDYRGRILTDMNLDAVLARHPQLVLVDELAHTNVPGLRHPKRYQDVEEILEAGIDVYSTVNVQHLESLKDIVFQITGVTVRETVPDRIIDEAYEIELIDLPTDELLKRLHDGKVYIPDQAARALDKFFRKGNLTALRELSLRRAADRVDSQMLDYMQTRSISGPWPVGDRIMVCVSSHPMGERLIRAGRRLADDLKADWYVVFVETPGHMHLPASNQLRMHENFQLAEELGAQVLNVTGESVADSVIEFAHKHNITKIIAGKPMRPRWFEILRGSVIDQIIRKSGQIDVYIVSEDTGVMQNSVHGMMPKGTISQKLFGYYAGSILLVLLITVLGFPLRTFLEPTNLVMLYLVAVVLSAVFWGRGPSILASVVSVLAFDFFFIDPRLTFTVNDTQYILTFISLLIVGLIISNSASLLRNQVIVLRRKSQQSQALNNLSRELTGALTLDQVLSTVIRHVYSMFMREIVILLPEDGILTVKASTPGFIISESEMAVADWAFKHGKESGRGTNTLPAAAIYYIPLITANKTVGILGSKPQNPQEYLSDDQRLLMEGVVNLAAITIERAAFAEKAAQAEMLHNTEKLQTALLNSISHELRTPLATITGVLTSFEEEERMKSTNKMDPTTRLELLQSATRQAGRLNHIVENLLDMTRLEAGAIHLNREPTDIQDLIGSVSLLLETELTNHPLKVEMPSDFPLIMMDAVLIAQVLENLLDNSCKYSAAQSPITLTVEIEEKFIRFAIHDQGIGIPINDLERVFDKFYRVQREETIAGTGLGLSICKGIVEAHGGKIWAVNNPEGGATVTFMLPLSPEDLK